MMKRSAAFFAVGIALSLPGYLQAKPACKHEVAKVLSAQGKVTVQFYGTNKWQVIAKNDSVCSGDTLRTSKWSRAALMLSNKSIVSLDQNTTLSFSAPQDQTASWLLKIFEGVRFFRSRQLQRLHVQTPFINAVHEGTEFIVAVKSEKAEISVLDGQVAGENGAGKIKIKKGEKGVAEAGKAPSITALKISPQDAVQWSLYYPPIIGFPKASTKTGDNFLA